MKHAILPASVSLAVGLLLVVSGCSGQPSADTPSSSPSASSSASQTAAAPTDGASGCVSDPALAIANGKTAAPASALPAGIVSALDSAAQSSFVLAAAPGAIVGVQTPEGTWTAAYGSADPATSTPMAVGMHTRIASLTKMYTGTLVFQLAEQGKLSLDDTIGTYVDGIPNGERITLRQLMDMTSGVASYTMSESFVETFVANPEAAFAPTELVSVGASLSPLFAPGEGFAYSNTNTVLLGLVIEKVTGKPFAEALQSGILTPLKLANTSWPSDTAALPEPYAHGFTLNGPAATPDAPTDSTAWNPSWSSTSGEIISDIGDLLTMGRALGTGDGLLDDASQTDRLTGFGDNGYGLATSCSNGWVGHSGELAGYNTSLFYDTATDTTVAVQTNSDIASGDCAASATLADNPADAVCATPAVRMLVALTSALDGMPYAPPPAH